METHQQHTDLVDLKKKQECIIVKKKTFFFSDGSLTSWLVRFFSSSCFMFFHFFSSLLIPLLFISFFLFHIIIIISPKHTQHERARQTIFFLSSSWQRTSSAHECECGYFLRQRDEKRKKSEAHLVIIVCFEVNVHQCERVLVEESE